MSKINRKPVPTQYPTTRAEAATTKPNRALFWVCVSMLVLTPLVFSTSVYRTFVLPKFAGLTVGTALIALLLGLVLAGRTACLGTLKSKHVALALLYVGDIGFSTLLGVSPLGSLFGSYQSEVGLITRCCFFVCFVGLIVAVGSSERRLMIVVWSIAATGLLTAIYAVLQFFGWDPFIPINAYTTRSPGGSVVRVIGTLGHSNYLGNFLLYTAPLSASLAMAWRGRARRIALVGVAFSVAAIAFSGTRGAWLGILVGAATLAFVEIRKRENSGANPLKQMIVRGALPVAALLGFLILIVLSPASRQVALRARSFVEDRFTGSGRVLLWRDAVKMVPRFALTGCGAEAFSREFLAYKSLDLARSAPQVNNESSHNSYLDAAISFGLPGAMLYAALIASALSLLLRARRRADDRRIALVTSGLLASLAAIAVHNFFIYDQVPTGLYFFAFISLALVASNVIGSGKREARDGQTEERALVSLRWVGWAVASSGTVLLVAATWFAASLVGADVAMKQAMVSARAGDFEGLVANGERATRNLDPTGAYNFEFARALALYADTIPRSDDRAALPDVDNKEIEKWRAEAIEMAIAQARKSLAHTLTPDANYVMLAYLALAKGDIQELHNYASWAIGWDPNYFSAHWLMAEALLKEGDREGAQREAQLALRLNPAMSEARSVLARARGEAQIVSPRIQGLVERARALAARGNLRKAEDLLHRAIRDSGGPCPPCHRELALTFEKGQLYKDAIAEWKAYAGETPDSPETQEVRSRIEALKKK